MKHLKTSTLIALMFSSISLAQTRDDGRPVKESKATQISMKAGEPIGEDCRNKITHLGANDVDNKGIMFDVEALADVRVSSLMVKLTSGFAGKVYVHRKLGTHVGSEGSPFNWLLVDSATVVGNGGVTFLTMDIGLNMNAGETHALYVRIDPTNTGNLSYANGTGIGSELVNDGIISLKEGTGVNGNFGAAFAGRQFNGVLHYCTPTTVVCDTAQTVFNNDNGNFGIFFDVTTDNVPVTINQFYPDLDDNAGGKTTFFEIYTRTGTFVGNESSSVGWTNLSAEILFSPTGNSPVATSDPLSLTIPANSTQGFLLFSDEITLDYTNGVNVGDVVHSEPNLTILSGKGTSNLFSPILNDGRNFNGVIDFCVASSAGLDELNGESFTISPNPANNSIHINGGSNAITTIEIINQQGKVVEEFDVNESNGVNVDVSMLPPSVYFVTIETETGKATKRFVKL